jgi:hypothetical protein
MSAMTPTPDLSQGVIAKPARAAPVRWRDGRGLVDGGRAERRSAGPRSRSNFRRAGEKGWLVSGAVHRVLIYFRTEIQHRQRERDLHEGTIPSPFRFHKT